MASTVWILFSYNAGGDDGDTVEGAYASLDAARKAASRYRESQGRGWREVGTDEWESQYAKDLFISEFSVE